MNNIRQIVLFHFVAIIFSSTSFIYPHESLQISEYYYDANGIKLFVKIIGEGTPLVILHGGPGLDHTYLLPQFEQLAKDYKLIFYDQRGSGKSGGEVDSISLTLENFVKDLEGLRKAIGLEKINLLGHSWGGLLAMHYVLKYPNNIDKIILLSSMGASSEFLTEFVSNRESRRSKEDSITISKIMNSEDFMKGDKSTIENLTRLFFRSYFFDQSKEKKLNINFTTQTAKNFIPIFNLLSREFTNYDLRNKLNTIKNQTLLIHGDYDPIAVKYAKEIKALIKNSELVVLKNCGHFPFVEAHEQFINECIKFLR